MTVPASPWAERAAPWVNLILPGAGLILVDSLLAGVVVGLLFTACANLALVELLLFPDEWSRELKLLTVGVTVGTYFGAQLRLVVTMKTGRERSRTAHRRARLWEARALTEQGEHIRACEVLNDLCSENPDDLLVNYRLAQSLTDAGEVPAAREAWQRVRSLDRHGIYRAQIDAHERRLA